MHRFSLCVLGFLILAGQIALSQDNASVIIKRLTHPVNFDGVPDEECWTEVNPLKLTMHAPYFGKEPSELSDVRCAYDEKYFYLGAKLYYKDLTLIRSSSYKRDYMGLGGDLFGFILDTYDDNENGIVFYTTPDGLRFDASIQRDAILTRPDQKPMNLSWNAFWDVSTKKDSSGWTTEFRIPLSSLRFQNVNGEVKMGLIVKRWIPAKNEIDVYPAISPNWGEYSSIKPSQAQQIILKDVTPAKPLLVAPYVMAGYESNNDLNEQGSDYWRWNKKSIEAGLDVKYGITSNMILDLTVNTDFAQVEADDEKINLTRMALFFPEKRLFFLERANIFDFNSNGNNNLFYSRRIGLYEDENGDTEPVRIYGGAKLTGRIKKWELGILDMQTAPLFKRTSEGQRKELLPSENFGVTRLRRQVINSNSYVGAIFTSRLGRDGSFNVGYGMDGIFRVFGDDYLVLLWSQTFEDSVKNASALEPARLMLMWERRSRKGLGYDVSYSQSGVHYNPGIGFETIEDVSSTRATLRYTWLPDDKSGIFSHGPELRIRYNSFIESGELMTFNPMIGWKLQTKSQWQGDLTLMLNDENLDEDMEIIDDVFIEKGRYRFLNLRGDLSTPQSKQFFTLLQTETGNYYGGSRISFRLEPTWNISRHFEIGGTYNFDHIAFNSRNLELTNHIIGLKALYMLNTRFSANAFIQHNTADHDVLTNVRIRYNPREGNDFYIMFNEGRNTSLNREAPRLPVYSNRSVMMKYTYTFSL
jgi:hypothetical protein